MTTPLLIIRILFIVVAFGGIATYVSTSPDAPEIVAKNRFIAFLVMLPVPIAVLVIDLLTPRKRVEVMSGVFVGLLIGVLLSYLFNLAVAPLLSTELFGFDGPKFQGTVTLLSLIVFPYLCITFILQTRDQFRFIIPYVEFARELKGPRPLVLDSSALIDGRIADVIDTNIVDSQFIVPQFILQEVQDIADSHDKVRRSRGRRGLDVLKKLQTDPKVDIKVHETDTEKGKSIDLRLVELTRHFNGRLVTNDVNLNKLAGIQGVDVINLNDVANSLKPRYIPGESLRVKIIKEGESQGQGVGYLDDGTMVVVEQGSREIGQDVDTVVTSVLQNSAGRMIFSKLTSEVRV
jgi:uncharacterized protein YacL